jgi:hypothetical protein
MAKEERDPARDLSRAARSVVVAVISRHLGITVVALAALPVVRTPAGTSTTALATRYQSDPLLGIVSPLNLLLGIVGSLLLYLLRAWVDRRRLRA